MDFRLHYEAGYCNQISKQHQKPNCQDWKPAKKTKDTVLSGLFWFCWKEICTHKKQWNVHGGLKCPHADPIFLRSPKNYFTSTLKTPNRKFDGNHSHTSGHLWLALMASFVSKKWILAECGMSTSFILRFLLHDFLSQLASFRRRFSWDTPVTVKSWIRFSPFGFRDSREGFSAHVRAVDGRSVSWIRILQLKWSPFFAGESFSQYGNLYTHRIHVCYIYLHLVDFCGKCRYKYTIHGFYGIGSWWTCSRWWVERPPNQTSRGKCVEALKRRVPLRLQPVTAQKSPKITMFKGSYLFQTIILGIHVSFRDCSLSSQRYISWGN